MTEIDIPKTLQMIDELQLLIAKLEKQNENLETIKFLLHNAFNGIGTDSVWTEKGKGRIEKVINANTEINEFFQATVNSLFAWLERIIEAHKDAENALDN